MAFFKKILLNLYCWPVFLLITLLGLLLTPVLLLANLLLLRRPWGFIIRQIIRVYGLALVRTIPLMAPITLHDLSGGINTPVIFVPNHNSSLDPYLFGLLPFDNAFVTSWPFHIPIYNIFMRLAGYINSNQGWEVFQQAGTRLLAQGCSLVIWPEGHRSRTGEIGRFKNGAFQLAASANRPIVPVCIIGSFKALPPGARLLNPSRLKMILLPPIDPADYPDGPEGIKKLKERARQSIADKLSDNQAASREMTEKAVNQKLSQTVSDTP